MQHSFCHYASLRFITYLFFPCSFVLAIGEGENPYGEEKFFASPRTSYEQSQENQDQQIRRRAEQGEVSAQYALGWILEQNCSFEEALKWYKEASTHPIPQAFYRRARILEKHPHLQALEEETTLSLYEISAAQGYAPALYALGVRYEYGEGLEKEGVEKDLQKAADYYRQAAEQKHVDAQFQLAWLYMHEPETRDPSHNYEKKAFDLYMKAAKQGHIRAQNNLGWMYEHGKGTPHNKAEAKTWYSKAAQHNHQQAKKNLEILNAHCVLM